MQPNYPPPPAPGGYPQPPQAYPPPPGAHATYQGQVAQYHQQQAPPPPPAELNLIDPTGGGGGDWAPMPRHLMGQQYAVLIAPRSFDPNNQGPGGAIRPQITFDMVIVGVGRNGEALPPIEYGDNQDRDYSKQRPNCFRLTAFPAEYTGVRWTNSEIVKDLAPHVGSGGLIPARIVQGTQGNRPPLLEKLDPNDPARAALVEAWHQRTRQPGSLRREVGNGLEHINGGPPVKQDAPPASGAYAAVTQYPTVSAPPPPGGYGMPPQPGYGAPPPGAQVNYQQAPPPGAYPPPPGQQVPAGPPPMAVQQGWTAEQWEHAPAHVKAAYGA